jgi:cytochrome P450
VTGAEPAGGSGAGGPAAGQGAGFPLGAGVTVAQLTQDPHPVLARLRAAEPVSWLPALGGWLVTRRDLADQVLRDAQGFTVDDPRFTTARVVGPSMLSLDGPEHRRHRDPFAHALRRSDVSAGLAEFAEAEAARLVAGLAADRAAGAAELRRGLAGPLAVAVMGKVLGLGDTDPAILLSWYDAIVAGVSALTAAAGAPEPPDETAGAFVTGGPDGEGSGVADLGAVGSGVAGAAVAGAGAVGLGAVGPELEGSEIVGPGVAGLGAVGAGPVGLGLGGAGVAGQVEVPPAAVAAFAELRASLEAAMARPGASSLLAVAAQTSGLSVGEVVSNAAVMLFGGIETTEGMIVNAVWHLLGGAAATGQGDTTGGCEAGGSETGGAVGGRAGGEEAGGGVGSRAGGGQVGEVGGGEVGGPGETGGTSPAVEVLADRALIDGAIDESLRLEPAAAVVDRYATAAARLGPADIRRGDLVIVSLAGANRDPAFFPRPDAFDVRRPNARQNLGFALGPHFCVGAQLARMETKAAISALLDRLPGLRLDPDQPAAPRGLVFRKPPALPVLWDPPTA